MSKRIALGGKPEFAVALDGKLFVNLEDKSQLARIDTVTNKITGKFPLAPCEEPTGLAADEPHKRLIAVCSNHLAVSVDANSGKVLGSAPIGDSTDGVAFDEQRGLALAANGEGNISVLGFNEAGAPSLLETVPTKKGARTIAFDARTGHALTATARLGEPDPEHKRGAVEPGTFELLVFGEK